MTQSSFQAVLQRAKTNPADFADIGKIMRDFLLTLPRPHFSPAVYLGKSGIAGRGLIANRLIDEGEVLVVERGPRFDRRTVEMIEAFTGYECNCCVGWGEYLVHAPLHEDGRGGYLNHSCHPNVGMIADATWAAMRAIAPHEEITADYGTFETMPGWQMECSCGAPNCRGTIRWTDYKIPELRARLGTWFAPYLREHASQTGEDLDELMPDEEREGLASAAKTMRLWDNLLGGSPK